MRDRGSTGIWCRLYDRPSYRVDVIMMKSFHRLRLMRGIDQSNLTADCITYGVFVCFWKEKYSIWYVYYSMIVIWKSIFYDNGMISDSTQNLFIVEDDLIRSKYFPLDYQNFHSFHTSQLHIQFLFTPKMPTKRSPITPKRKSAEINESSSDEEIKVYTHVWQI